MLNKISYSKLIESNEFKRGQKEFREGTLKPESVQAKWYRSIVPVKKWNEFYSKSKGYTLLGLNDKEATIGFSAVVPPQGCLEITNQEELRMIDAHLKSIGHLPRPLID